MKPNPNGTSYNILNGALLAQTSPVEEIKGKILDQREDAIQRRVKATKGPQPTEVRISSVSFDKKVSLGFNKEMVVPSNFTDILNVRNKTEVLNVISNE